MSAGASSSAAPAKLPPQIPYIIGNEACERFSFYGMRNILTAFLVGWLLVNEVPDDEARKATAKATFHLFVSGVYFFPLLGGFLADRFLGKYRTILALNLVYCAGHACLALFESSKTGFYAGLFLIALGSGGIKPCVSAMVGDQFDEQSKALASKVFAAFYWSINLGSFFASLLMPVTLRKLGPAWAFGIPGILMGIATLVFWLGGKHYVKVPPTGRDPHSFFRVVGSALANRAPGGAFFDGAEQAHPKEAVDGARAVVRLLAVFLPVPFFWMLFDQKASTWVLQADKMDRVVLGYRFEPSQMQVVNPALVMVLLPLLTGLVYPAVKRLGYELLPLRRMTIGMVVGASSYVVAGLIDLPVQAGHQLSILWQLLPYLLLTTAEILVSVTGLEFAYSQAPRAMKGTIMSLWNLNVTAANVAVAIASALNVFSGSATFFFYAGLALVAALALGLVARRYRVVDYYQVASGSGGAGT